MKHILLPIPEDDKDIYADIILRNIDNNEVQIIYEYNGNYSVKIPIYDVQSIILIVQELIERSYCEGFKNGQDSIRPE